MYKDNNILISLYLSLSLFTIYVCKDQILTKLYKKTDNLSDSVVYYFEIVPLRPNAQALIFCETQ